MSLKNPVTPPGIDPGTVRLVVQRLNHYATPGPLITSNTEFNHQGNTRENIKLVFKFSYDFCKRSEWSLNSVSEWHFLGFL